MRKGSRGTERGTSPSKPFTGFVAAPFWQLVNSVGGVAPALIPALAEAAMRFCCGSEPMLTARFEDNDRIDEVGP